MKSKTTQNQKAQETPQWNLNGAFIRLFLRMMLAVGVYSIAYWLILVDMTYPFFERLLWTGVQPTLLLIYFIGIAVIVARFLYQPFHYVTDIFDATKDIYTRGKDVVKLPRELRDFEVQLSQLKVEYLRNEQAAKEAEQRKNDLITYLAHDLKTPISSIIGYLDLLQNEKEISPEMKAHYINITHDKAQRLDELIDEFFEITRFNIANIALEYEQVDLSRLLEQLVYEFKPMFAEKNLSCALELPRELNLRCDINKMQRVFDNLLRNAVSYSFPNSEILVTAAVDESKVKVVFENKGNTISKEKLSRIFDQFYRLNAARSSNSGGAGLGLAIAKEITEAHNGTISAFSENEIIRFTVTLPLL